MRAFIALEIPPAFSLEVLKISQHLQEKLKGRFVPQANYHLTLAFLGDIPEEQFLVTRDALQTACTPCGQVILKPTKLAHFGNKKRATLVLAMDGTAHDPALSVSSSPNELAQSVRSALTLASLTFDEKDFYPHITLARKAALEEIDCDALSTPLPKACCATKVTLFQSHLSSTGARYEPRFSVALNEDQSQCSPHQ